MKQLLLFTFVFTTFLTQAQNFQIADQYVFGGSSYDSPRAAIAINNQTIVGGASLSGISGDKTTSNFGDIDIWVVSMDNNNTILWQRGFGGTATDDLVKMIETSDGNVLIGGFSDSWINGNKTAPNKGLSDFWIIKIDDQGNELWQKTYGGSGNDYFSDFVEFDDGSILLVGESYSGISGDKTESSYGQNDGWIVKIDAQGNVLWDKTIGGSDDDGFISVALDENENIFVTGSSSSPISGLKTEDSYGSMDYWVLKLDENGNVMWDRTIGGTGIDLSSKLVYSENRLFVIGNTLSGLSGTKTESSRGSNDIWITKLNQNGAILMDKAYGGNNVDNETNTLLTESGELVMVGTSDSDISGEVTLASHNNSTDFWILVNDTSDLSLKDQYKFGSDLGDYFPGVIEIENNSLLIFGNTEGGVSGDKTVPNVGMSDFWLLELSTDLSTNNWSSENNFTMYPNPANHFVQIDNLEKGQDYEVKVYNVIGKEVLETELNTSNNRIDVEGFSPGIYTVTFNNHEQRYTQKLVIE
ncbi:T9SS type A sorting domain-containing protein [Brumimicrobium aurantiacum]|uniref:T9SS C-terminal target domain-containing protein n=1 Tax=Brumimicrobium aurantiacum TaxID=1737063 RepID=A0A3E1F1D2_9FLAO|nr:T9SS type A sorting domain-containing protein [Brumimicrobium aurantiacum]RFC55616.1 T9SS C-terminal target domain-containing protein [Brumimicrobium aurantiacum]